MQKIFYSELLKLRHLGTTKFLIIIPFLTVLIAFLMGGLQIFVPFSVKMLQTGVSLGKFL